MPHLRILIWKTKRHFVGQCLEKDFCAHGSTIDAMLANLTILMEGQAEWDRELNLEPLAQVPPAPPYFEHRWRQARPLAELHRPDVASSPYAEAVGQAECALVASV